MLALLPVVVWVVLWRVVAVRSGDARDAVAVAAVLFGVGLSIITEGLSLFHLLMPGVLLLIWSVILIFLVIVCRRDLINDLNRFRPMNGTGSGLIRADAVDGGHAVVHPDNR